MLVGRVHDQDGMFGLVGAGTSCQPRLQPLPVATFQRHCRQLRFPGFDVAGGAEDCHANGGPHRGEAVSVSQSLQVESWYDLFSGAFVISRRPPKLKPVEARRVFFVGGQPPA
jgi:hypothetical protein